MKCFLLGGFLASVSLLSACGGSASDVGEQLSEQQLHWLSSPLPPKELVGSWKQSRIIYGRSEEEIFAVDEVILVITESGEQYSFDYRGDDLASKEGKYDNCYRSYNIGQLRQKEGDMYSFVIGFGERVSIWSDIEYQLTDQTLIITEHDFNPPYQNNAERSDLTLGELESMACL